MNQKQNMHNSSNITNSNMSKSYSHSDLNHNDKSNLKLPTGFKINKINYQAECPFAPATAITSPAHNSLSQRDLAMQLTQSPHLSDVQRYRLSSNTNKTPSYHQRQFKGSSTKRKVQKRVSLNSNMLIESSADKQSEMVNNFKEVEHNIQYANPPAQIFVDKVDEKQNEDSSSSSSSSSDQSDAIENYQEVFGNNMPTKLNEKYKSIISEIQMQSHINSKNDVLNKRNNDLRQPQKLMSQVINNYKFDTLTGRSDEEHFEFQRLTKKKQKNQRIQTRSFLDIIGKQRNQSSITIKGQVSDAAVAQSSGVSSEGQIPLESIRTSLTFNAEEFDDVDDNVLNGAKELFIELFQTQYGKNQKLNKQDALQIALKKDKPSQNDNNVDQIQHDELVNELIDNIFESKSGDYQMSQHEFVKLLIEQIKTDRHFQKDFTEVSSISELKNDSQIIVPESPQKLKVDEELQDQVEQLFEPFNALKIPDNEEQCINIGQMSQETIDNIKKRQQRRRTNSSIYSNNNSKRPIEILNINRKRFIVQCYNQNTQNGEQIQDLTIDDVKALKLFQYDENHKKDEIDQIKNQNLDYKLKIVNEIEKHMVEMQELFEQGKKDAILEAKQKQTIDKVDETSPNKLDYTTLRFNEILILFYYHIEQMEEELDKQQSNVEILREEIKFLEEHQNELQAMNQQEAQKNVLSEQFNDKLMNDYEALNEELISLKKENQMFVQQNTRMNSQIKEMDIRMEQLLEQSQVKHQKSSSILDKSDISNKKKQEKSSVRDSENVTKLKQLNQKLEQEKMKVMNDNERSQLQINQLRDYNNDLLAQIFEMKPFYDSYLKESEMKDIKIKSLEEELKILREKQINNTFDFKQHSQANYTSQISKGRNNKGLESANSLMELEQLNDYQIGNGSGLQNFHKFVKTSQIHLNDEASQKPPLYSVKQKSRLDKSSLFNCKQIGSQGQENNDDNEILELSLNEDLIADQQTEKQKSKYQNELPVNLRLDLAEINHSTLKRSKSARDKQKITSISVLDVFSQSQSCDFDKQFDERNKQIELGLSCLKNCNLTSILTQVIPQYQAECKMLKIQNYEQFSFVLMKQQDLLLKIIKQMAAAINQLQENNSQTIANYKIELRMLQESYNEKECEKCKRDQQRLLRNNRKDQLLKQFQMREPIKTVKPTFEKKKSMDVQNKEPIVQQTVQQMEQISPPIKPTPKRQKPINPKEQYEQLRAKNLLRYQLLCGKKGESKFDELIRKHKNIQQMYGVVGGKIFDQDGNFIEDYQPNLDPNAYMTKVALKTTLDQENLQESNKQYFSKTIIETNKLNANSQYKNLTPDRVTKRNSYPNRIEFQSFSNEADRKMIHKRQQTMSIEHEKRTSDVQSKDIEPLEDDQEVHNMPSYRRKTQQELDYQMKKILEKKQVYNMICEPSSNLNIDGGLRLQLTFKNIKQLTDQWYAQNLASFASQQNTNELIGFQDSSQAETIMQQNGILSLLSQPMGIYSERVHLFKKNKLKECLLIVTRKEMFICKIDGSKFNVEPFDFMKQIDTIIKCIRNSKRETYQAVAIQLKNNYALFDKKQSKRSHIILVHGRRENYYKFIDFLNYQIYASGDFYEPINIIKKSQFEYFEVQEKNRQLYFQFQNIGFHRIENDERKLNMIRRQCELKDVLLKRINGIISNHWVNCFIELIQPSAYALSILQQVEKQSSQELLRKDLEQFLTFNFGVKYKKDYEKLELNDEKEHYFDQIMQKFSYSLLLKVGAANISQSKVSEKVLLNRSMKIIIESNQQADFIQGNQVTQQASFMANSIHTIKHNEATNTNMSIADLNLSSNLFAIDEKQKFTLYINDEMHQFAAVDRNLETFEKWCSELKQVENLLKKEDNYQNSLETIRLMVHNILTSEDDTPRTSFVSDTQIKNDQKLAPKQIFEYNKRIMELTSKYKTQTKNSKQNSFQKQNQSSESTQVFRNDQQSTPLSNFMKYQQSINSRMLSPLKTTHPTTSNQINKTLTKEKIQAQIDRGSFANLTRSLSNYTDAIQYFQQRKDSKGTLIMTNNDKTNDIPGYHQHEKSHDHQLNGDTGILSPISSNNSEKAMRKTVDAAKVFQDKRKLVKSRSPQKKPRERSFTFIQQKNAKSKFKS